MGAAILITLGMLFLFDNYGIFYFDNTWPVLLIVLGVLTFAGHNASMEGHIQPYGIGSQSSSVNREQNDPRQSSPEVKP